MREGAGGWRGPGGQHEGGAAEGGRGLVHDRGGGSIRQTCGLDFCHKHTRTVTHPILSIIRCYSSPPFLPAREHPPTCRTMPPLPVHMPVSVGTVSRVLTSTVLSWSRPEAVSVVLSFATGGPGGLGGMTGRLGGTGGGMGAGGCIGGGGGCGGAGGGL